MAKTRITNRLEAKIKETRDITKESMGDGACRDYAGYQHQCGYIRGLDTALALIEEIENGEDL